MKQTAKQISLKEQGFSFKARFKSFCYAWAGIIIFFRTEHNAQIHLAATINVICLSVYFKISTTEALFIIFSVALVWITELVNTAIEKSMDMITLEKHPQIKLIKDLSAGAVLIAAIAAFITGCLIFIPKFLFI